MTRLVAFAVALLLATSAFAQVGKSQGVVDANTIRANVTVKGGGSSRDRAWDVRVGPGVLPDGFTVQP